MFNETRIEMQTKLKVQLGAMLAFMLCIIVHIMLL